MIYKEQTFACKMKKLINKTEKDILKQQWVKQYEKLWYKFRSCIEEEVEEQTSYGTKNGKAK